MPHSVCMPDLFNSMCVPGGLRLESPDAVAFTVRYLACLCLSSLTLYESDNYQFHSLLGGWTETTVKILECT